MHLFRVHVLSVHRPASIGIRAKWAHNVAEQLRVQLFIGQQAKKRGLKVTHAPKMPVINKIPVCTTLLESAYSNASLLWSGQRLIQMAPAFLSHSQHRIAEKQDIRIHIAQEVTLGE